MYVVLDDGAAGRETQAEGRAGDYDAFTEDAGWEHGSILFAVLEETETREDDGREDEKGDDPSVCPAVGITAPLEREEEA